MFRSFRTRLIAALAGLLLLGACQAELYSSITEREANEMLVVLLAEGIDARKINAGDGTFSLSVGDGDVQRALAILDANGLPRSDRASIGQVFAGGGIVSSPFEQRIRYIYALGEEVAQTLQQIDGVLVARVHIVMPEDPALGQEVRPSSAAVFIKQRAGYDLDFLVPQIRRLVANSIEGVDVEAITVALVEASPEPVAQSGMGEVPMATLLGVQMPRASVQTVTMALGGLALLAVLALGAAGFLAYRLRALQGRRTEAEDGDAA
ncbi:type III secretion system inner membrane ring lipoprotein SctJ [Roseicyclus amphidinii]|uniref:type III secretion system inner membrane ring lipoprotein SctJ n=1 Tax=Roseicyclus amphidinii TaxID=3034232 RepID=UPI0024E0CE2C|nr:type III secretion inner membrane ring lipoprotein SctJ [Roseicyclus sp. Amp-Y-6]